MKKGLFGIMAIAAMAMVGCSQEDEQQFKNLDYESFTGAIVKEGTRSSLGDNGKVLWSDGDAISLFKKSGYYQIYTVASGGDATATFEYTRTVNAEGAELDQNYAVYPADDDCTIDATTKVVSMDLTGLANQTYVAGSFDSQSAMVAKSTNNELSFYNVLSVAKIGIKLEVPNQVIVKEITLAAEKALSGKATVDMSGEVAPATIVTDGSEGKMITLPVSDVELNADDYSYFYILLPAGEYDEMKLTIKGNYNGDGEDFSNEFSIPTATEFERNIIKQIHVTLKEEDFVGVTEGTTFVSNLDEILDALKAKEDITFSNDIAIETTTQSNSYGATGFNLNGGTLDGNGKTLSVPGANTTWTSAISTQGGTIKNLTIDAGFRGVFVVGSGSKVILENVIIDGPTYTISCDQASGQGLEATKCTFNGWTSYAATIGNVKFVECNFGKGAGYAFCRPYAPTEFVDCAFEAGFRIDAQAAITFENCTLDGVVITAENLATLVTSNTANASVK